MSTAFLCHGLLLTVSRCLSFLRPLPSACHRTLNSSNEQHIPRISRLCQTLYTMQSMQALLDLEPSSSSTVQQHALKACLAVLLATTRTSDAEVKQVQATARHINVLDTLGRASTSLQYMTGMPTEALLLLTAKQHKALLRKASKTAGLRSNTRAVQQQSFHMQQQQAAGAVAAASGAGFNQSSASAAATSAVATAAAATAAAFAEQMADEVPQPDTPGLYCSIGGSPFGLAPGKGYTGSSGSSMPAAADSYCGASQNSLYSAQPLRQADCSSYNFSSSSKAAGFGWGGQYDCAKTWQQQQQQSLFGVAAADTASPAVFDSSSSNTAAAACAGDAVEPNTVSWLAASSSSTLSYSSSEAALRWGSQDDTGLPEQRSSSNSWQQAFQRLPLFGSAADDCTPAAVVPDYASFSICSSSNTTAAAGPAADDNAPVLQPDTPVTLPSSTAFGGTASRLSLWASDSFLRQQQNSSLPEQPGSSSPSSCGAAFVQGPPTSSLFAQPGGSGSSGGSFLAANSKPYEAPYFVVSQQQHSSLFEQPGSSNSSSLTASNSQFSVTPCSVLRQQQSSSLLGQPRSSSTISLFAAASSAPAAVQGPRSAFGSHVAQGLGGSPNTVEQAAGSSEDGSNSATGVQVKRTTAVTVQAAASGAKPAAAHAEFVEVSGHHGGSSSNSSAERRSSCLAGLCTGLLCGILVERQRMAAMHVQRSQTH
jgi:hypothetical protein